MRMHACPHCGAVAVRNLDVRWSSREWPATCGACQRFCHVLASTNGGIDSMTMVLAVAAVAAGLLLGSWLAFAASLMLVVGYNIWAWRQVELFPISAESARNSARAVWVIVLLGVLSRILS